MIKKLKRIMINFLKEEGEEIVTVEILNSSDGKRRGGINYIRLPCTNGMLKSPV